MVAAGAMADLALHVGEGLLAVAETIPVLRSIADHVADDASRLIVPVNVEQGLIRARVLRRSPLVVLDRVTGCALFRADIVPGHSPLVGNLLIQDATILKQPFHNLHAAFAITFGADTSLTVGPGWDNVTGFGQPNGLPFIKAVGSQRGHGQH